MEEEEEKEKIPHMCESIGHRPLRDRCPNGDQLSDRPTNRPTDGHNGVLSRVACN